MSRDNTGANGVTNHVGEVFVGNSTSKTHSGLIVVDGALIPGSLGVNPGATIAALAERAVAEYAQSNGLVINTDANGVLDLYGNPSHYPQKKSPNKYDISGETVASKPTKAEKAIIRRVNPVRYGGSNTVCFTELMSGFVHTSSNLKVHEKESHRSAEVAAKGRGETARLFTSNVMYVAEPQDHADKSKRYKGIATGTFVCSTIKGSPFMITHGEVSLLCPDNEVSGTTKITYDFEMTGVDGRRLGFHGYKTIDSSASLDIRQMWRSTTTLYVTITEPQADCDSSWGVWDSASTTPIYHSPHDIEQDWQTMKSTSSVRTIAAGILHIGVRDFRKQLLTLTPTGRKLLARAIALGQFTSYFTGQLAPHFFLPFSPLKYATKTPLDFINPTAPTQTYIVTASDGVRTELHMWEPEPESILGDSFGNPLPVRNLFMIPGAAVDHQIYALPTIPFNAVNYFTRAGYRVFVTVHRIGIIQGAEDKSWTTYDARLDIKACLEYIRMSEGTKKVYCIAHCMGSVAFASGLLDGTIPSDWVLGVTCSQVFMNPIWSSSNKFKSSIQLDKTYTRLAGHWFNCRASTHDGPLQSGVNQMLRLLPDRKGEKCNNASCHRITLLFGRCWSHLNLNEATHRHMDRFFNGANMTLMPMLMRMGISGAVSTNAPSYQDLTSMENVERLRGIPFFLFSGGDSDVLSPLATEKTYERLCDTFGLSAGKIEGGIQYRRKVIPGYGHLDCWMGQNAWRDVFPMVREEVDRVVRGEAFRSAHV